jgi:hypothetical protein
MNGHFSVKGEFIERNKGISVDKGRKKTIVRKFRDYITYFIRKEERNERQR